MVFSAGSIESHIYIVIQFCTTFPKTYVIGHASISFHFHALSLSMQTNVHKYIDHKKVIRSTMQIFAFFIQMYVYDYNFAA